MRPQVLSVLTLMTLAGCSAVPSARALQQADYGAAPGNAHRDRIRTAFAQLLIDGKSADYQFDAPEQGWGRDDQGFVYGWVVWTKVNSKNQFGAFTGWKTYKVLTTKGDVHSIYEPQGNDLFGNPKFQRVR